MLGEIKLILNGTQTRAGLTTVGNSKVPEDPELAGLIRWSSERKGGEIKSEDGIDKQHCGRGRVRSVEESGEDDTVESSGLCFYPPPGASHTEQRSFQSNVRQREPRGLQRNTSSC